jgi:hypothetical protein
MEPGKRFGQVTKSTRGPLTFSPNRYPLSLFLSLTAGPTYRHHQLRRILLLLFSVETATGVYSPAVIARTNGPSRPVYKRPQHSSSISLSSSCTRRRQDRGIPRRTSASLRASPVDSDLVSEPRPLSSLLSSLSHSDAFS